MRESGFADKNQFNDFIFSSGHDAIIIKHSATWGDEIILPGPGCVSSVVMIDEMMKTGGTAGKIKFDKNDIPSKRIYQYTQILKENYPKVWALGGNVFGNKAYRNLERVIKRGYWLESEEWMYVKWKSFVARHAGDFLIAGIIANLKWMVFPARGAEYSKEVVREEIMKRYPEKEILLKDGGEIEGGETSMQVLDEGVVQNTDKAAEILARVQELTDTVDGYRKISLDPDDEVRLTLRIKDRKGTKDEKGSEDYFLSIVITDKVHISHPDNDELKQDEEEFVFGSEYTPSEIVEFINGKINECQREEGIEDCPRTMETGGHVGSDTVTMNVPLLIRVFELVREDVKDDRELHFMAERILDIARKGTLTMEDYDYIAGTLEKPEIQEAIADAGYEVQEMADGGIMNKYAICTASLGRKYGMQRSLWDEETMDKYERCLDSVEKRMDDGGEIESLMSNGTVDLKFYQTTPEHAKEFGIEAKNPIYVQNICVSESSRLKGVGKKVLDYLDEYARKNGNDVIFGYVAAKASFSKDSRLNTFCDVDMVKYWLHDHGYAINEENNDFHKVIRYSVEKRMDKGGRVSNPSLDQKIKQYKELAHAGKTASEILEEIGVDEGVYGENNKEYIDFYLALAASDLSSKKFPKKARPTPVQLEGVEIPLKLKEKNVKITGIGNKDDILQLLKGVVGDDDLRPAMQGVYFDAENKAAVATDAHKLVFIPDNSIKKSEIINPADGNIIDGKFPNWKMIIPDYGKEDAVRVNVQYMLNVLHTVLNSAGYLDMPPFVVIVHGGEQFGFNAHVMYPVFEVMAKMGFDEVTMYLNSPRRAALVKTDSDSVTGLIMPLMLNVYHEVFPGIYTILENGKEVQSSSGRIKTEPTEREIREFLESLTILSDAGDTDAAELLESMKIIYG
jgi:GNAT superfamily N-acetyltransferase